MLKATHYNEQLLDWIKNEKETDWNAFTSKADNRTYCFKTDEIAWLEVVLDKVDCASTLGGMYRRYATLKTIGSPASQVETTIYTEWQEAGNSYSTKLHTIFTVWE